MSEKFCLGQCSYDLYAEIHQNYFNRLIHGLFMPFLVFGVFTAFPPLIARSGERAWLASWYLFCMYLVYYSSFDMTGGLLSVIVYSPALYVTSKFQYQPEYRWEYVKLGFFFILGSVGIQELVGHTFFEATNSDLLQLPNSILIAPLFGTRCLFHIV